MSVISVLATSGRAYEFTAYDSTGESGLTIGDVRREARNAARLIIALDPSPRKTIIVHEG